MYLSDDLFPLAVAARSSPLSQVQVEELLGLLRRSYPEALFEIHFLRSHGDCDLTTTLRAMEKTDFFTREIDEQVLLGRCRVSVHSAKDLPQQLPPGLKLLALTPAIDSSDSLVMKEGCSLESLPQGAVVATSSERREEAVREMRGDLTFIDIRGTIGQRLAKLEDGSVDAVVIAEAAILRLGLKNLNRITIPGSTTPHQGQLAIVGRIGDDEIEELFSCVDTGERV